MTENVKSVLSFVGRLALSGILLVWLFSYINWKDIITAIKGADAGLLWWSFAVYILLSFVVLVRWYIFMISLNLKVSIGQVCRYFFIGLFCNLFLPTSIGGDLVKAYGLARGVGQKPKVYASVVLDRLSGFAGLVIVALVAYLLGGHIIDAPSVIIPITILTLLSLFIGGMLFNPTIYSFFCGVFKPVPRAHKAMMDMHKDVMLMKGKKRSAWGCVAISCVIQLMGAYMYYLLALALHLKVILLHFIVFSPIVSAVSFLPSIGGLGVREVGWVYLLDKVGIDKGMAAGISLISFGFIIVVGLIGGIVYVATFSSGRVQPDPKGSKVS